MPLKFNLVALVAATAFLTGSPVDARQPADPHQKLVDKLLPLIQAHQGDVAVCIRRLPDSEGLGEKAGKRKNVFVYRQTEVMPTASLIKVAVMVAAHRQAEAGKVLLDQKIELKEADKVPGSGILTRHFSAGTRLSLRDAIRLMIVYSDNTATNLVLDAIGLETTAKTMENLGLAETKIHAKVFRGSTTTIFPERSEKYGLGSTTAEETVDLLELIYNHSAAGKKSSQMILGDLKACEADDRIAAGLPSGIALANKSGSISHARCDAGIVYGKSGTYAICILTANNQDKSWRSSNAALKLCADISRVAYTYFNP